MYYVYLLKSIKTKKTYVGMTNKDVEVRLKEHNEGGTEWTRINKPLKLVYYESYYCKQDALHRELFLKSGVGNKLVKIIIKGFEVNGA